ncbi:MAG: dipeptidase [Planctomycetaceae bacterium]|jgi:succinyl-diaminopimelate desuccinylase|nr:dipeptidase [Planctomycetaceae bacterium]
MHFDDYIRSQKADFETRLFEILRIPSVSASAENKPDMKRCADYLLHQFQALAIQCELIATAGNPLVYAEYTPANAADAPVILIYGHYDVQPPDPLNLWQSPPFEPEVRNGNVYARGANDDKGQTLTHLFAVESLLKTEGTLPCKVKFILEGEEEVGSQSLHDYVYSEAGKRKLACDCILVSDTNMFAPGQPTITYGIRGILAAELYLTGPNRDLHSGIYGGAVYNPAAALTKILSQFVDAAGRIQIPHFYDDVIPLTAKERQQFAALPFDESAFFADLNLHVNGQATWGESGYSVNERRWTRPSFDINGLTAGYQGSGSKTIIPGKASAKFTFRLVPDQDPKKVFQSLQDFIASIVPDGITWELEWQHGEGAMCLDLEKSRFVQPMSAALEKTFDRKPVFIREGGSVPIIADCHQVLGADVLFTGWGQEDDAIHSPNEKFSLESFAKGIRASAEFLKLTKEMKCLKH